MLRSHPNWMQKVLSLNEAIIAEKERQQREEEQKKYLNKMTDQKRYVRSL